MLLPLNQGKCISILFHEVQFNTIIDELKFDNFGIHHSNSFYLLSSMNGNTYKSQRKRSFFTYLEHKIRLKRTSFYGLPGSYVPRLLFLFFMGIFYVGNTHYYEKMVRKIGVLEREVDTLRVDYTTLQADYAVDCKQSEVAKKVAPMGLHEVPYPPLKVSSK